MHEHTPHTTTTHIATTMIGYHGLAVVGQVGKKEYRCNRCNKPISFDSQMVNRFGRSIPLEATRFRRHICDDYLVDEEERDHMEIMYANAFIKKLNRGLEHQELKLLVTDKRNGQTSEVTIDYSMTDKIRIFTRRGY